MKRKFAVFVENQVFKITSVRDFQYAVVARTNVDRYIALGDGYSAEQQAKFQAMKEKGQKFEFFLDCWTSRLDLAEKKASALRNLIRDGVPCYIDVQIVPVKEHFGFDH